jgi:nucleotide-binding universal stress UspA family protein
MLTIKTILHPTDFSNNSAFALQLACSLAQDYGARLVVLHVAAPPVIIYSEGVVPPDPESDREALRQNLLEVPPWDPKVAVEHQMVEGDAATEILRQAVATNANLIVMGTHGRKGLTRLLMGSVAEQVVRRAPCPVVTVKTPLSQTQPAGKAGAALVGSAVGTTEG